MDENVAKAVERAIDRMERDDPQGVRYVRARLVELEAENERLRKVEEERWSVVATRNAAVMRAEKAEALLRECYEHGHDMKIHDRITAHLSENGHDHS